MLDSVETPVECPAASPLQPGRQMFTYVHVHVKFCSSPLIEDENLLTSSMTADFNVNKLRASRVFPSNDLKSPAKSHSDSVCLLIGPDDVGLKSILLSPRESFQVSSVGA